MIIFQPKTKIPAADFNANFQDLDGRLTTLEGSTPVGGNRIITASETATITDAFLFVDASTGAVVITLPAASAAKRALAVKKI